MPVWFDVMLLYLYPNPDIETHLRVQVINVNKESAKTKYTLLMMKLFGDFLGALRTCAIIVFFISGFGLYKVQRTKTIVFTQLFNYMCINHCRFKAFMSKHFLNSSNINTSLQ